MGSLKGILDREFDEGFIENDWSELNNLLIECIDYMTNVFGRCHSSAEGGIENIVILGLYRNIIQFLDGIQILLSKGQVGSCFTIMRNMFETLLTMEFILKNDTVNKSIFYMVCYYNSKINAIKQLKRRYEDKEIIENMKKDKYYREWNDNFIKNLIKHADDDLKKISEILNSDICNETNEKYKKNLKKIKKTYIQWYNLYDERLINLKKLVKKLED